MGSPVFSYWWVYGNYVRPVRGTFAKRGEKGKRDRGAGTERDAPFLIRNEIAKNRFKR